MELRDYLHYNHLTSSAFARQLGVHPNYLRMIKNGWLEPGFELATKIEILTGGEVTFSELRGRKDKGEK